MPQSKNLKMQWITIDGRPVPVVLPQVWDDKKQDWVVTSDINPLPTQDDLVMQKIEELNEKIDGIIDGTTPANTQLTGSIVENIFPRRVVRSTQSVIINDFFPKTFGAKGFVISLKIFGVTGTFNNESEGMRLRLVGAYGDYSSFETRSSDFRLKYAQKPGTVILYAYPGLGQPKEASDYIHGRGSTDNIIDILSVGFIPNTSAYIELVTMGTFGDGEGFDCRLDVIYLT